MIRWSELRSSLLSLARVRDPVGILSVTVGPAPRAESNRTPDWQIALRNALAGVRQDVSDSSLLDRRLEEIEPRLDALHEPFSADQSYAGFVALESGDVTEFTLPVRLGTDARVAAVPHLLPLLGVLEDEKPSGLVSASQNEIEVLESELGRITPLEAIDLEPSVGDWWPEMKGPAAANPARAQQVVSQRDRYERKLASLYSRQLEEGCRALARVARRRRWARAVLAGDHRVTGPLEESLAQSASTITTESNFSGLREADVRSRLRTELSRLVECEAVERVVKAIADEDAGGPGVTGLEGTVAALARGRVACLAIDPGRTFPGTVDPEGSLTPDEAGRDLTDWIVAAALAVDADVLPVAGEAATVLADKGGLGAALRW